MRAGAQRAARRGPPRADTTVDANSFPSPGPGWQPQPVPEGFDYDFWLGPAPEAPYHIERCFHRWRYILDYSNGQTANFGCHTNDMAQWALGMDGTTPVEFEDNGSEFLPKGSLFTTAVKTAFRARYANGIELTLRDEQGLVRQVRRHGGAAGNQPRRHAEDLPRATSRTR